MKNKLKAPFPYFGGKTMIAEQIWSLLGQPKHYLEPFFGSGAVLLNRPDYDPTKYVETVNDKDGYMSNVWRSIQFSPAETAKWCDWPVNHADLSARKMKLIENEKHLLENLIKDDEWHDVKLAGYWIWAASCWIGSGLTHTGGIDSINIGKRPHISHGGMGVHAKGISSNIYTWFENLSKRLRRVRVVCGDWTRICGGNWQDNMGVCGIYFDPPYEDKNRTRDVYLHDGYDIASEVEEWCLPRGAIKSYRIVCSGYDGEYNKLIKAGWGIHHWKANGGYGNLGNGRGKTNSFREILVYSPHCHKNNAQLEMI